MQGDAKIVDIGSRGVSCFVPASCISMIAPYNHRMTPGTPTHIWLGGHRRLNEYLSGRSYTSILWDLRAAGVRMVASQHTAPVAFVWDRIDRIIVPKEGLITVHCGWHSYTVKAKTVADISVDLVRHPALS